MRPTYESGKIKTNPRSAKLAQKHESNIILFIRRENVEFLMWLVIAWPRSILIQFIFCVNVF